MDYALEHGVSTHYRDIPFQWMKETYTAVQRKL
jgi:hypothetical protein